MNYLKKDIKFMRLALSLAEKGRGRTSPNPMVGAVVVKNNKILGTGYHKKAGGPHAEISALRSAGKSARNATLYVTLEPCNTFGRTPPCAPSIVNAGIKRVVIAAEDPNPKNHNNGMKYLRQKNIKVDIGILKSESIKLNESYNKWIKTGFPFVTIKAAMSIDGKIATKTGSSKWISCYKSRQFVRKLRKQADAVLVGRNTFLKDRPRFKGVKNKIFLQRGNVNLKKLMKKLAKKDITHVLIEGGGETIASAINANLADKLYIFIAPKIIGGRNAKTPVEGLGIRNIAQALNVKDMQVCQIGNDIMVYGYL